MRVEPMTIGELREAVNGPQSIAGVIPIPTLPDWRKVIIQIQVDELPGDIPVYEYYSCRAVGPLLFNGEFVLAIAAGGCLRSIPEVQET